jgi:hypothetical protein
VGIRSSIIEENEPQLIPSNAQFMVHGLDGEYLLDKCKWPKLNLSQEKTQQESEEMEGLTQEESLVSQAAGLKDIVGESLATRGSSEVTNQSGILMSLCGEDLMDNVSVLGKDSDVEEYGQGWQAPKSRKTKKSKKVLMTTRTSSRIPRDGVPIATKAIQRAVERDNMIGTSRNSFTILNSTSNARL